MTAGNIAAYIGVPRPTVMRRLNILVASGHVEKPDGDYQLPIDLINSPGVIGMITECERLIHSSAAKLSKMDTDIVAKK